MRFTFAVAFTGGTLQGIFVSHGHYVAAFGACIVAVFLDAALCGKRADGR
jgi:hypothetical protein